MLRKYPQGITQKIDVKPEETMKEFVARVEQLGTMEKVRINMIQHSCTCNNDLTDILLEDIILRYKCVYRFPK